MCHSRTSICIRTILVLVLIGFSSSLSALANRVFVSARSGNNANSCDNIATPCQTFAGAVAQLNPGGEAIVLDSGGYGPVTITKAVTIEAPPGVLAFVHPPSGDAITINAGASDTVVLRGLVLNVGSGNGIKANTVGALFVEDCAVTGFANFGIWMAGAGSLELKNTDVKGCGYGVEIDNSSGKVTATIDHCHLDGNTVGGFRAATVSPGSSKTTATNSTANGNQQGWTCGFLSSGADVLNLESCSGSENSDLGLFVQSLSASTAGRYSNCVFANNGDFGVKQVTGGSAESRGNNTITGNGLAPTSGTIGSFPAM